MTSNNPSIKACACCKNDQTEIVLQLEPTPMEDQFLTKPIAQPTFPLDLALCKKCGFAFLPYKVSPEASYKEYIYNTNITNGLAKHYDDYATSLVASLALNEGNLAFDLGSNDGTMLKALKSVKLKAIGIEPAKNIAAMANDRQLETINSFFTSKLGLQLAKRYGKASLITANYMFANIPDLDDFLRGVYNLLADDGVFVIQTGYHPEQFKGFMFDYIYHEHFSYFTIRALEVLLLKHGLQIFELEKHAPKGGSIRVFVGKTGMRPTNETVIQDFKKNEQKEGWHNPSTFLELNENLSSKKSELIRYLDIQKRANKKIVGFGASHSTTTLIYEFGLAKYLDFIVDDNSQKHGTFSPGYNIPVLPSAALNNRDVDILVILAWQHQSAIMERHNHFLEKGTIAIPLPELRLIS